MTVTNDGATILRSLHVDNPAAKVLVDLSRVQDEAAGDGTTSVVVLAGELLRGAEALVSARVHPMTVVAGYRAAAGVAADALESGAVDRSGDPASLKADLVRVARTTLSSKILSGDRDHFAALAVDAVLRLKGSTDLSAIHILKKAGGTLAESWLDEGFILAKPPGVGQPTRVENARILVANTAMDTDKIKIYGAGEEGGEPVEPVAAAVPAGGGVPFPRIRARMRVASSSLIELLWLLAAMESFSAASSTSLFSRPRSRDSS